MLVDSHCHLDYLDREGDLAGVLVRAREAGVGTMLTIGTRLSEFDHVRAIAEAHDDVWCTVGVHPHEAAGEGVDSPTALIEQAAHPQVVGIGESGLDYYYEHSPRAEQQTSFRGHIAAARETDLPLVVHTRDADDDTMAILEEEQGRGAFPGLIHCFSSGEGLARRALDIGFYISFSGIVTFKKAEAIQDVARSVPLDRMLIETDAPYLAPVPLRGKRNEPAYVAHTAAFIAKLRDMPVSEVARITTDNFFRLFTKATRPAA
jgi:TatD DNase family protein